MQYNKITVSGYRNDYIDFLRGLAAICIVAIHTAFWSGGSYTPAWFQNMTLLVDVPFFFYLSGWGASYNKFSFIKAVNGLINIWKKWIFFVTLVALFCYFSSYCPIKFEGVKDIVDLVNNYIFAVSIKGFCVIAGSVWFMPWYLSVFLLNTLIVIFLDKTENPLNCHNFYLVFLVISFVWTCYHSTFSQMPVRYFLFYSFFWMLGVNRFGKQTSFYGFLFFIFICIVGFLGSSYLQGLSIAELQKAKFPPSLKYGFASMFVILVAKYFEGKMLHNNNFITHIGSIAIFYYFAQGIGSSLSYYVVSFLSIQYWFLKWVIVFLFNLLTTILLAETLARLYYYSAKFLSNLTFYVCKNFEKN